MTKNQACQLCAKRKIRCDHGVPCSNCKRLKISRCVYSNVSPQDRINQLEALVEELRTGAGRQAEKSTINSTNMGNGSNLESQRANSRICSEDFLLLTSLQSQFHGQQVSSARDIQTHVPDHAEENGRFYNLEPKHAQGPILHSTEQTNLAKIHLPSDYPDPPHALTNAHENTDLPNGTLYQRYPTVDYASILWEMYMERVDPLMRVCYKWWLEDFRTRALNVEACREFSLAEHALLSAIYLISIVSMSKQECETLLHQPRKRLIEEHERISSDALLRTNLFCLNNIRVLQAVMLYSTAGYNRLSTQSLWSLMGLAIRSAEKLEMHKDGTGSEFSPCQIEERRRIWWQLLQGDLAVSIRTGTMSMILLANWDVDLPLNIEDEDISPTSTDFPPPRKGLTSNSLFRYFCFTLGQQRKGSHANQNMRARSSEFQQSVQPALKDSVIKQLEEALNEEFLRYCDPIKPLDVLIQLLARFLIASMRLKTMHAFVYEEKKGDVRPEHHAALLEIAMQCLEYRNAGQSHPMLQKYRWMTGEWMPFQAFMLVLVEAVHEGRPDKAQQFWDPLSKFYDDSGNMWDLWEDRRKYQAAQLVVIAWKTWQKRFGIQLHVSNPGFAEKLERELVRPRLDLNEDASGGLHQRQPEVTNTATDIIGVGGEAIDTVFDMELQDIDWSFWNSID